MKKRKFPILLVLGAMLVFVSFALVIASQIRVHIGAVKSQDVVAKMNELLPERNAGIPELYPDPNMPVLEIDETDYVALIEIPALNVALPVADKWNSDNLFDTPARFYGSAYDHTMVIGGGDYAHQFSFCDKIDNGTYITVTDMTGTQFTYTVSRVDRSKSAESQWLVSEDYDLTLFCQDHYSTGYIAVRCKFVYH